ncbi:MAG: hypothetical protein U5K37_03605 [Natrialbaceae archaeon]|nr:hypothetical protein [Natrialbaceae archaeon]
MTMEREATCPTCGTTTFDRAASTRLHLGTKVKWTCGDCGHTIVEIDGVLPSAD